MSISTYLTGWLTKKTLTTALWIAIPLFLIVQCNRGCGSKSVTTSQVFDYTAIIASLPKDTTAIEMSVVNDDLNRIMAEEMIQFTKHYDELFVSYMKKKYRFTNGYLEKVISQKEE